AILDPPCADITGRLLETMGKCGVPKTDPQIQRAIRFIRETQEEDGSWFGRWGVNYVYGTWQVLRGLRAVGYDMNEHWVIRGRDWLECAQNPDGGWGESCGSYDDSRLKGRGISTASQTGNISCEGGRALCLSKITPTEVAESTLALLSHSQQS
ncbi:MAG: hypothetical protein EBT48_07530, partial [Verrucomicrobia bacterium]|nr:hypothetical protein [Verrucomicrobiota bacterium]